VRGEGWTALQHNARKVLYRCHRLLPMLLRSLKGTGGGVPMRFHPQEGGQPGSRAIPAVGGVVLRCREGERRRGAENGRYANRETALIQSVFGRRRGARAVECGDDCGLAALVTEKRIGLNRCPAAGPMGIERRRRQRGVGMSQDLRRVSARRGGGRGVTRAAAR
jgi:hypothetical protein